MGSSSADNIRRILSAIGSCSAARGARAPSLIGCSALLSERPDEGATKATGIELKCGACTIKITPAGIELKAPQIKIQGMAQVELKAPMLMGKADALLQMKGAIAQVNGDGVLMVKGGITMIN